MLGTKLMPEECVFFSRWLPENLELGLSAPLRSALSTAALSIRLKSAEEWWRRIRRKERVRITTETSQTRSFKTTLLQHPRNKPPLASQSIPLATMQSRFVSDIDSSTSNERPAGRSDEPFWHGRKRKEEGSSTFGYQSLRSPRLTVRPTNSAFYKLVADIRQGAHIRKTNIRPREHFSSFFSR